MRKKRNTVTRRTMVGSARLERLVSPGGAANIEAQLRAEVASLRAENTALKNQLEYKTFETNGVQLELQTRHYEVPFLVAQMEGLMLGARFTEPVRFTLKAIQSGLSELMKWSNGQPPSMDPASWVALSHKLGISPIFMSRRMPAVRGESTDQ